MARLQLRRRARRPPGEVRLLKDLDTALDGRNVVIVEDIVDTGLTLTYLQDILRARDARRRCAPPAC